METLQSLADISDENIARLTRILHQLDTVRPLTLEQHNTYVHTDWELARANLVRNGMARSAMRSSVYKKAA